MACNKTLLSKLIVINNEFVNNTCITNTKCKYLNVINLTSIDSNDTLIHCLKHNKSVMGLLNENPEFECQKE